MARRRADTGTSVNLFPFLSILVSIIGCLTLIIVVINLIAMGEGEGQTSEEVERAQKYLELEKEKKEEQKNLEKLKQQVKNLLQKRTSDNVKLDRLAMLKKTLNNQEQIDANRNELIAQFSLLQKTNKKLIADHESLLAKIKSKEEEIAKRKLPPEAAALRVRPSGSSSNTKPYFVEISDTSIYLYRSVSKEPVAIAIASLNQSEEFINLLKTVASKPYNRLIFLVRGNNSAAKSYNAVNGIVTLFNQQNNTRIIPGRLPLPGEGKIDLQMFAKFLDP